MRRYLLILFAFFLISACNCTTTQRLILESPFEDEMVAHYYKSTVRILGSCPAGMFTGTGFVGGPEIVVTAKHVAYCDANEKTPALLLIVRTWDGRTYLAIPDQAGKLDTATLKIVSRMEGLEKGRPKSVEGEVKFDYWARQTRRHPKLGERLCYVGGSVAINVIKVKCGTVFHILKDGSGFWIGVDGKGGNSGGPVFDRYGLVIGVATAKSLYGEEGLAVLYSDNIPYITIEIDKDAGTTDADPSVVK